MHPYRKHYIKPWYKRIFHKHYWLQASPIELETDGIYTKGYLYIEICSKCPRTKTSIKWGKKINNN